MKKWPEAVDDYARVATDLTTDDEFLANQALAMAEMAVASAKWTEQERRAVTRVTDPWQKLAAAYRIQGNQAAIDRLIERRPQLAGPIGDLFTQGIDNENDSRRAIALFSKGITAVTDGALLLAKRARAYERLKNWNAAAADWSRAANGDLASAKLFADFARRLAAGGQVSLATDYYEKSRALYERLLAEYPENNAVAAELARVLLDHPDIENPGQWTVLDPSDMKSQGGATMTRQADGSILVSGKNPDRDVYSLVFRLAPSRITSIRLETLPDPSLTFFGPGRSPETGEFQLNELRMYSGAKPCILTGIVVTHDKYDESSNVIDGRIDDRIGWDTDPYLRSIAVVSTRLERSLVDELKIEMYFSRSQRTQCNLGRFRLSKASLRPFSTRKNGASPRCGSPIPGPAWPPPIGWLATSRLSRKCSRVTHRQPSAAVTSMPRPLTGSGQSPNIAESSPISRPTVSLRRNSPRPTRLRAARSRRSLCL